MTTSPTAALIASARKTEVGTAMGKQIGALAVRRLPRPTR
jgi:hypothetical protein